MLDSIKKDFLTLLSRYESLKAENEKLQAELNRQTAVVEADRKQIRNLTRKIETLGMSASWVCANGSTEEAKQKLDSLLRQIDRCIALLENK